MYKLLNSANKQYVVKTDGDAKATIPFDPANTDFQEYQRWLAEGNTPQPADTQE